MSPYPWRNLKTKPMYLKVRASFTLPSSPRPNVVNVIKMRPKMIVRFEPSQFLIMALKGAKTIWATENIEMISVTSNSDGLILSSQTYAGLLTKVGKNDATFNIIMFPTHSENRQDIAMRDFVSSLNSWAGFWSSSHAEQSVSSISTWILVCSLLMFDAHLSWLDNLLSD